MKQDCRNVADKSVQAGKAYISGASVGAGRKGGVASCFMRYKRGNVNYASERAYIKDTDGCKAAQYSPSTKDGQKSDESRG
jgi:hypothetical protein